MTNTDRFRLIFKTISANKPIEQDKAIRIVETAGGQCLTIFKNSAHAAVATLYSCLGQTLISQVLTAERSILEPRVQPGTYLLEVTLDGEKYMEKILIH